MFRRQVRARTLSVIVAVATLSLAPTTATAQIPDYQFAGPVFGIDTAPDGSLLVADGGAGIVEFRKGVGSLVVDLPGVADMSPVGRNSGWAITFSGDVATEQPPSAWDVHQIHNGRAVFVADLLAFEKANNPDGGTDPVEGINSNPYDVVALNASTALVADAGGNDVLIVDHKGNVDWIAVLPPELVSTANLQSLLNCPDVPVELSFLAFVCGVEMLPAESVPTSIAIGPDGAYYVAELKGFPAPTNESRIWRIEPGTRHFLCQNDPAPTDPCQIVADGFTAIVNLRFGPDGTLYVTELDEASWAFEFGLATQGGTVNACNVMTWSCSVLAGDLVLPTATAVGRDGTVYVVVDALANPTVIALP